MTVTAIPYSVGFKCGVQHERERIIRLLEQRCEDLCLPDTTGLDVIRRQAARSQLQQAITAIREA